MEPISDILTKLVLVVLLGITAGMFIFTSLKKLKWFPVENIDKMFRTCKEGDTAFFYFHGCQSKSRRVCNDNVVMKIKGRLFYNGRSEQFSYETEGDSDPTDEKASYAALEYGLRNLMLCAGLKHIVVFGDNLYVMKRLRGTEGTVIATDILSSHDRIVGLCNSFKSAEFRLIARELNIAAYQ